MTLSIVIPWRDSGDRQRRDNAEYVIDYYTSLDIGPVIVASDGKGSGPFNRSAAYNRGYAQVTTDVVLWNEADTVLPAQQILDAADLAQQTPGIVLPFTERHELDDVTTQAVLDGADPFVQTGAIIYPDGRSIGQAGVTSRATMRLIGRWDEGFCGWGYDDDSAFHVFNTLAGPPRWIEGKGVHLWHTPAYQQPTPEAAAATARNAQRFHYIRSMTPDKLREYLA